jgi:hypothetical protein
VADNQSLPSGYGGGAIVGGAEGFATIERSVISGNSALKGGGLANSEATVVIVNSTISGNSSTDEGGGILNLLGGATQILNATITLNQADSDFDGSGAGGGVSNAGGTVTFQNTILAANSETFFFNGLVFPVTGECNGTIASDGYNIMENYDTSHCTVAGGGVALADPVLGPLQNNGGPTPTHALLAGSPAIDAGDVGGCTDDFGAPLRGDQRSYPRPAPPGGRCDIGAFEVGSSGFTDDPLIPGSTPVKASHITELRSRIDAQRIRFGLAGFPWTDGALGSGAIVKAVHVLDLREALVEAYEGAARYDLPEFTDASLVATSTPIRAVHLKELRDAVLNLENN